MFEFLEMVHYVGISNALIDCHCSLFNSFYTNGNDHLHIP